MLAPLSAPVRVPAPRPAPLAARAAAGLVRVAPARPARALAPPSRRARAARGGAVRAPRAVLDVVEDTFEAEVLKSDIPVLVDVWAGWCGPCKLVAPLLPKVEAAAGGALKVVKINADAAPSVVEKYKIYGLPALLLFKDGALVPGAQREGAIGLAGLVEWVNKFGVEVAAVQK